MPIITPAYPSQNSMRSATKSMKARMTQEFRRGYILTQKVITQGGPWEILVKTIDIFQYVSEIRSSACMDGFETRL
jgi:poly(A) polymerase